MQLMKLNRPSRVVAALIALCSVLFMQLALASYACPILKIDAGARAAQMAVQGMADCADMDMAQPGLCQAAAHPDHQSLDKPQLPEVQPFAASGLSVTLMPAEVTPALAVAPSKTVFLEHATAPPLTIRNCCFRI
ncbi:MAG: silD [Massilia sp.]|nr:silD [Massilia sp.]